MEEMMPHNSAPMDQGPPDNDPPGNFFKEVNIEFLIHELKDPLSVIESNAHLLLSTEDAISTSDSRKRSLQRILRHAQRARAMLWELLEVGRAGNACFECWMFYPAAVVRKVILEVIESNGGRFYDAVHAKQTPKDPFKRLAEQGLRLDIVSPAESVEVAHDEAKFHHIIANLLKNAFYYHRQRVIVHLGCSHDQITVAVRDDGPGIAPEHHGAIFDRYKQITPPSGVARSGHGLGLAIARILARTMGGDISLESQLGQGAVFRLILPNRMPEHTEARRD
jgi:two-component system, OmpR family, sensor kinase